MPSLFTRREALVAGLTALAASRFSVAAKSDPKSKICVFTEPFNSLSFDELADRMAEFGVAGIEAPIRNGGHIAPTAVEDELPKLVEALQKRNLEITVMASDINDPDDPLTEKVLRVAAGLGIKRYRMQYFMYDLKRSVPQQLLEWKPKFVDLAALNKEFGIKGLYQNHAGSKQLGAALWDLREVLQDISPEHIAVAYDIRHATVEGGQSWPITFNMIRPHIDTVFVKDARWVENKVTNVPLGQGIVDPKFFKLLADSNFTGPICLHEEYIDHASAELVPEHLAAIGKDLQTLRDWLNA